jgi:hypothetical protein
MRARKLFDPTVPDRSWRQESTPRASRARGDLPRNPLLFLVFFGPGARPGCIPMRRAGPGSDSSRRGTSTNSERTRALGPGAAGVGSAARVGGVFAAVLAAAGLLAACRAPGRAAEAPPPGRVSREAQPAGASERYCAWYGDARGGTLYFGESAFWSASRAHGSPLADRLATGPRRIGRFDLARRALLPPLEAGPADSPTGVWDVLAHPNGRVYFTTWFDAMGWVDPATGERGTLDALGIALNEIALGPGGKLLVSRYGDGGDEPANGSVVLASEEGELVAEYPLVPPEGHVVAPKTVGYDAARGEIWVTTDVFATGAGPTRHDAYVLDQAGRELRRFERPEVHFAAFRTDGSGVIAEVAGPRLVLRVRPAAGEDALVVADEAFPPSLDFVQDVHFADDGRAVVTRWSGLVHVVSPDGSLATLRMPPIEDAGLYYSGVLAGERVCATHCGGIDVACAELPEAAKGARAPAGLR